MAISVLGTDATVNDGDTFTTPDGSNRLVAWGLGSRLSGTLNSQTAATLGGETMVLAESHTTSGTNGLTSSISHLLEATIATLSGAEVADATFALAPTAQFGAIIALGGVNQASPVLDSEVGVSASGTSHSMPAVTVADGGIVLVEITTSVVFTGTPSGYTVVLNTSGGQPFTAFAYKLIGADGTEQPTFTIGTAQQARMVVLSLSPPPAVTGTAAATRTAATASATGTQTFTGTAGGTLSALAGASAGEQAVVVSKPFFNVIHPDVTNRPLALAEITDPATIIYANPPGPQGLWEPPDDDGPIDPDTMPSEALVRAAVAAVTGTNIVVLDIEVYPTAQYSIGDTDEEIEASVAKLITILGWAKDERPDLQIGCYGIMPRRTVAVADPADGPGSAYWIEWQRQNDLKQPLADAVDFIAPSIYTVSATEADWADYATYNIQEAQRLANGKPVYPFMWPQYHNSVPTVGLDFLAGSFWRDQLDLVDALADGILFWGVQDQSGVAGPWDYGAWWTETLSFLGPSIFITDAMLAVWRCTEGSGNTLADSSGNGNTGTADGTLVWVSDANLGTVPDLGGTVQIDCGDVAGADGAVLTIAGWVKFDDAIGTAEALVTKWNTVGDQRSWMVQRTSGGNLNFLYSPDGIAVHTKTVTNGFNGLGPYHYIIEFNAGAVAVWLGNVSQTVTGSGTATSLHVGTASVYIGGHGAGGGTLPGDNRFKDIAIWYRSITADERQDAYDGDFTEDIIGTAEATLSSLAGASAGGQAFIAAAQAAMSAVTAAGQGGLLFTGTSAANLAAMAATAAGDLAFQASASALLGTISGEAAGDVGEAPVTGIAAAVLAVVTSEAFASLAFSGTADASLSGLTAAALAEQVFTGTASAEASGMLGAAAGELSFAAAVSALLEPIQGEGEGSVGDYATAEAVLQALTAEATGGQTFEGAGVSALATLQGAAAGGMSLSGAAAALLAATTAQATGTFGFSGEATATLAALVAEALAEQVLFAQGAGELQALEAAASGGLGFAAAASALLAALTAQGTAALEFTGTASATLQALTGLGAQILVPFVMPGRVFTALAANRTTYALPYNRTFRAPETNRTFTVN